MSKLVVIDIDQTLYDFYGHFCLYLQDELGLKVYVNHEGPRQYDFLTEVVDVWELDEKGITYRTIKPFLPEFFGWAVSHEEGDPKHWSNFAALMTGDYFGELSLSLDLADVVGFVTARSGTNASIFTAVQRAYFEDLLEIQKDETFLLSDVAPKDKIAKALKVAELYSDSTPIDWVVLFDDLPSVPEDLDSLIHVHSHYYTYNRDIIEALPMDVIREVYTPKYGEYRYSLFPEAVTIKDQLALYSSDVETEPKKRLSWHSTELIDEEETLPPAPSLVLPSAYDVLKRWPRALTAISSLMLWGDQKHSGDGRDSFERGSKLDLERYDSAYSYEKMVRHLTRLLDLETHDEESGQPHGAAVAWHAINALEAYLEVEGLELDDVINYKHAIEGLE